MNARMLPLAWSALLGLAGCDPSTSPETEADTGVDTEGPPADPHVDNLSFVSVDGDTIAYLDYGSADAPVLLLLHGIPTSSRLYREVAPRVAEQSGFRVIAPDLLGFGASDKPQRPNTYSAEAQAARVLDFADTLDVGDFVLGVHDIGGFVGWEMLEQDAERIEGLIVVNTSSYAAGLTPAPRTAAIGAGMVTAREAWEGLDGDPEFARVVTREFLEIGLADPEDVTDTLVAVYAAPLSEGTSEAFIQFTEEIFPVLVAEEPERRARLADYEGPAMVLHGAEDRFFSADIVPALFAEDLGLSDDRVIIVDGAGHYIQEDDPDAYVAAVVAFLAQSFP